jgi:hypothetical protein
LPVGDTAAHKAETDAGRQTCPRTLDIRFADPG